MITVATLRRELALPASEDWRIETIRQEMIDLWERETGLLWDKRTGYVEVCEPVSDRTTALFLSLVPVTAITKVEEQWRGETSWTTVDATSYTVTGRKLRRITSAWAPFVRVTYDGGAEETQSDIQRALVTQAQFQAARLGSEKIAIRSQNFEGGSGVYEEATIHPFFAALVKRYGRVA